MNGKGGGGHDLFRRYAGLAARHAANYVANQVRNNPQEAFGRAQSLLRGARSLFQRYWQRQDAQVARRGGQAGVNMPSRLMRWGNFVRRRAIGNRLLRRAMRRRIGTLRRRRARTARYPAAQRGGGRVGGGTSTSTRTSTRRNYVRRVQKQGNRVAGRKRKSYTGRRRGGTRKYRRTGFTKKLNAAAGNIPYHKYYWQATANASTGTVSNASSSGSIAASQWLAGISSSINPRPNNTSGAISFPFGNHPIWLWDQAIKLSGLAAQTTTQPNITNIVNGSISAGGSDANNQMKDTYIQFRGQRSQHILTNTGTTPCIVRMWIVKNKKPFYPPYQTNNDNNLNQNQSGDFFANLTEALISRFTLTAITNSDSLPNEVDMHRLWEQKPTNFTEMQRLYKMRMKQFTLPVNGRRSFMFHWAKPKHLSMFDLGNACWRGYHIEVESDGDVNQDYNVPTYDLGHTQIYYQFIGSRGISNDTNNFVDYGPANISVQVKRWGSFRWRVVQPQRHFRTQNDIADDESEYSRHWGGNPVVVLHRDMPTGPTIDNTALPVQIFGADPSNGELIQAEMGSGAGANALQVQQINP